MRDDAESSESASKTEPNDAKKRAIDLARVQATDDEIKAVLRVECGMTPATAERRVSGWAGKGLLEDARTAGRLVPAELLLRRAEAGDTTAAVQLYRRQELLDGIDVALLREVKRIMALEPSAIAAELVTLGSKLGAA